MKKWKWDVTQSNELNAGDTTYLSQVHSPIKIWIVWNELRSVSLIILKA